MKKKVKNYSDNEKRSPVKDFVKKTDKLYILSFFIPALILFIIFVKDEIFPFGDRSFLHIDMYHQYLPFLVEFYHKLKSGESLLYSWNTGIGTNFVALYAYYLASPFNWLCVLVPEHYLMEFLTYLVVLKTGFCGLSFTYYIRKHFHTNSWMALCFSLFYALSGFLAAYNWDVMWLDVIVLTPLIILGLEKLVHEGNCKLYCITLGLSILSNYYLSIMLCIFLTLYFAVLLIAKDPKNDENSAELSFSRIYDIKSFYLRAILRFVIYSLIAGGMAAILLIPEWAAIKMAEFSNISFPKKVDLYFPTLDMIARHFFNVTVETGLDHWPNIYCGVAVLLLLPLYILQKKIPMREKVPKIVLLGFILISFSTNVLNFMWHGFNYPDSLPARQSFLYIFLMLMICYEAFTNIREHSIWQILSVFAGALAFLILCEKVVTDDSFSEMCFFVTGIFLVLYTVIICYYKTSERFPVLAFIVCLIVTATEAGENTYLTSVPTVSRDSYLTNYDSYQIITNRTVANEGYDFFRFDKFARRTQNDAMMIDCHGSSYFSSTINSLVSDFYKKYGMKGSRVNYCFDGATPVSAAFIANRYMLYTLDRGYDNVYEFADREGDVYLYKNNYAVPFGFMITETDSTELDSLFVSAAYMQDNIHTSRDDDSDLNPLERQNKLVHKLGITEDVFIPVDINQNGSNGDLYISEDAHYYAYTSNTKIDDVKMSYEDQSKTFSQISKKFILDLGYHNADKTLNLKSANGESLDLAAYKMDTAVLDKFITKLREQTLTVNGYNETSLSANINVTTEGHLVMSVAYEPSWSLYIDGQKVNMEVFENTFISVPLDKGEHTIELRYFPKGLIPGAIVSIISIGVFIAICMIQRKNAKAQNK
ncbi:MAG: YfhO family protein [Lachnospiraceae bacterium]|nr:YfhO family protein [Lachnospiraceae bacterium]